MFLPSFNPSTSYCLCAFLLQFIRYDSPRQLIITDFAQINMFRSRYANFLIDDDGSVTVSGSGRDVIIPTLSYGLDEIESGAVGLPMGVRQLVEKYPKV